MIQRLQRLEFFYVDDSGRDLTQLQLRVDYYKPSNDTEVPSGQILGVERNIDGNPSKIKFVFNADVLDERGNWKVLIVEETTKTPYGAEFFFVYNIGEA